MALAHLSDDRILDAINEHGSVNKAAEVLSVARSTLQNRVRQIEGQGPRSRKRSLPQITRESLHAALLPPNNCKVKVFLDSLDEESRDVVEEALGYPATEFNAGQIRDWLIKTCDYPESVVPAQGAITDHRQRRRPCRCDSE